MHKRMQLRLLDALLRLGNAFHMHLTLKTGERFYPYDYSDGAPPNGIWFPHFEGAGHDDYARFSLEIMVPWIGFGSLLGQVLTRYEIDGLELYRYWYLTWRQVYRRARGRVLNGLDWLRIHAYHLRHRPHPQGCGWDGYGWFQRGGQPCGGWTNGRVLCAACQRVAEREYPQGWRWYPGDVCEHGMYTGGCGADYICGYCEDGVSRAEFLATCQAEREQQAHRVHLFQRLFNQR